jgi:hypothetical protein
MYVVGTTPDVGFNGTISWAIYDNNVYTPKTIIASGQDSAPLVRQTALPLFAGMPTFETTVQLPDVFLSPGHYWISFHEGPYFSDSDLSQVTWVHSAITRELPRRGDPDDGLPVTWPYSRGSVFYNTDLSFQLNGVQVPEPNGIVIVAALFVGVRVMKRTFLG